MQDLGRLVRHFVLKYPDYRIINIDSLTYAGNLENLKDIENQKLYLYKCCITDTSNNEIFKQYKPDGVIHLVRITC